MLKGKNILFYEQLHIVIEKSIKLNIKKLGISAFLREKVEEDCEDFVKHQDFLTINDTIYNRNIIALIIGEVLFDMLKGNSKTKKFEKLSDRMVKMYKYGENPSTKDIISECKPIWKRKLLS